MLTATIRKATTADRPFIAALLEKTKLGTDGLNKHLSDFLVAETDGRIAGTIGLEIYGPIGLLRSVAVLPDVQNKRIGDRLVTAITEYARERGISELILLTTTASGYFLKKGFVEVKREEITGQVLTSEQFRGACPSTAIAMRKFLTEPSTHNNSSKETQSR